METIYKSEDGNSSAEKSGSKLVGPSLSELISEIDSKTDQLTFPENLQDANALEPAVTTTNIQSQFILFGLEEILFALPLASALEIGHRPEVTRLPNLPNWVLGISNIRGQIISLVNLKAFLGIPSSGIITDSRFIIVHNQDLTVGIIVDRIMGMLSLDRIDTNIQNSPYREGDIAKFISGVAFYEDNLMNILDIEKLLSSPRMNSFKAG